MIRVNLLFNKLAQQKSEVGTAIERDWGESTEGKSLITNVALCFGGVILLYFYQAYNMKGLDDSLKRKSEKISVLKQKVEELKSQSQVAKKAEEEVNSIRKRMEIIKEISKSRLSALKALDYLQTLIPDRVWLSKLSYVKGQFTFEGSVVSDDDFNLFMEHLEQGEVFVDIVPVRFKEESVGKGKSFTVNCQLGNI